ncbi:hypothetical protein [Tropicibacter oceani]|uniref:Uncharacterized protein n=1 Tax=Tropicibacter oceani TaxID=3058420 RepID=A0ABY8QLK5_9RHOB|nr:hypothetical protein [Tropicibacter oceani]WGW04997.1 hypothetical protein QF118_05460 [Tropicibacter oceani]
MPDLDVMFYAPAAPVIASHAKSIPATSGSVMRNCHKPFARRDRRDVSCAKIRQSQGGQALLTIHASCAPGAFAAGARASRAPAIPFITVVDAGFPRIPPSGPQLAGIDRLPLRRVPSIQGEIGNSAGGCKWTSSVLHWEWGW